MKKVKEIAIMTGGGDCFGLNLVICAVVKTSIMKYGLEDVIGQKTKNVDPNGELVTLAKAMGVCFGD